MRLTETQRSLIHFCGRKAVTQRPRGAGGVYYWVIWDAKGRCTKSIEALIRKGYVYVSDVASGAGFPLVRPTELGEQWLANESAVLRLQGVRS